MIVKETVILPEKEAETESSDQTQIAPTLSSLEDQSNLDACYARAIELTYTETASVTCGELRAQLIREFGEETVRQTLAVQAP